MDCVCGELADVQVESTRGLVGEVKCSTEVEAEEVKGPTGDKSKD